MVQNDGVSWGLTVFRKLSECMSGSSSGQSVTLLPRASFLEDEHMFAHIRTVTLARFAKGSICKFAFQTLPLCSLKVERLHFHFHKNYIRYWKTRSGQMEMPEET